MAEKEKKDREKKAEKEVIADIEKPAIEPIPVESVPENPVSKEAVYRFKSDIRHNDKSYSKGDIVKGFGADILKTWLANGVILDEKGYSALMAYKKPSSIR